MACFREETCYSVDVNWRTLDVLYMRCSVVQFQSCVLFDISAKCSEMFEMDSPMPPAISELLRAGRLRKGLNLEQLARQCGVSRTTLHHLEHGGTHRPRAKTLSRLAEVLELDRDDLARGWETSPRTTRSAGPPVELFSEQQTAFDWQTNPAIQAAVESQPEVFQNFTADDWRALLSQFGVGGGLTAAGGIAAAQRIQADRDTVTQLQIILQTHLREPARQLIEALFQSIQIGSGNAAGRLRKGSSAGGTVSSLPTQTAPNRPGNGSGD
jgi:transcriptional regulator with XRE-family HTH domain